jgi:hypothetical protein
METTEKCHLRPRRLRRSSPDGYRPSSGQHSLAVVDRWRTRCSPGRASLIGADFLLRERGSSPELVTAGKCHLRPRRLRRSSPDGYRPSSGQHSLAVVDRWRASCSPGRSPLIGADAVLRRSRSLPELVTQKNVTSGHIGFAGGRLPEVACRIPSLLRPAFACRSSSLARGLFSGQSPTYRS